MQGPRAGATLLGQVGLLLLLLPLPPTESFLQLRRLPLRRPQSHPHDGLRSATALHSFWQGLQELLNPGGGGGSRSSSSNDGGSGLTPAEEEAKRRRHFRVFEPLGGEQEEGEVAPYVLDGASLPSMDDLWREAWPLEACKDTMQRREDINKYVLFECLSV